MLNTRGDVMMRILLRILIVICAVSFPLSSQSAETARLRYAGSVSFDAKGEGLKLTEGVACSSAESFIVADTGNGRLLKYSYVNGIVKGGNEIRIAQLSYPIRVQVSSQGDIFALDGKQRRIVRMSPDGAFKGYVEPSGVPSGAVVPRNFKMDGSDNIYVLDIFSSRVLVLGADGKYVSHLDFPEGAGFFSDLAIDQGGTIYLVDSVNAMVYSAAKDAKGFSPLTEKLSEYMNFPASIAVDKRGTIYLADQNGSGVVVLGREGAFMGRALVFGWKDGLVRYPAQLCMYENAKEELFVADRENSRIQIFTVIR
jgi:sugar lactone lactonase YvrE